MLDKKLSALNKADMCAREAQALLYEINTILFLLKERDKIDLTELQRKKRKALNAINELQNNIFLEIFYTHEAKRNEEYVSGKRGL